MGSPRIVTGSDQRQPAAVTTSRRHRPAADANASGRRLAVLSVTALGVVYGDIGTSPLYALRACFSPEHGLPRTAATVNGVLSLIVWSLILIVSVKGIDPFTDAEDLELHHLVPPNACRSHRVDPVSARLRGADARDVEVVGQRDWSSSAKPYSLTPWVRRRPYRPRAIHC
jgi:hypothetical protein